MAHSGNDVNELPAVREGLADGEFAKMGEERSTAIELEDNCEQSADVGPPGEAKSGKDSAWRRQLSRIDPVVTLAFQWSMGLLLLLFIAFIVFGILYSGIHFHGEQWHQDTSKCRVSFGAVLGVHDGVFGYSNCNDEYISDTPNTDPVLGNTGMRWQCVEYARRYWMMRGTPTQASFASVDGAADIWDLSTVRLIDGSQTPLLKYANGLPKRVGGSAPRTGDLLIYPRQPNGFPYGHVAVIVGVTNESVFVAEQNWENTVWPAPYHNYSREITLSYDTESEAYSVNEKDNAVIKGWIRYTNP